MKLTDLWSTSQKPTVSFELFPARTEKAAANLGKAIERLAALKPDFVSVTFGAGGSTREGSRQLVKKLQQDYGLEVVAYFAGYGLGPDAITAVLDDYHEIGVESILVVRGDIPKEQDFEPHPDSFAHATDLVAFIRPKYDFCIGVAGYPEGHIEAESKEKDLDYLKQKVDLGAEYIIANYFYDNDYYFDFVDRCREIGIEVPILPGVMPVYSVKMMKILAGICGATITDDLTQGITALPEGNSDALVEFGIDFAVQQCAELINSSVPGLHIYTMDRSKSTAGVVKKLRAMDLLSA
jgi:methylenetetrahydrofolate reductase (NADPH)